MATKTCCDQPTFQDLAYALDALLDQPDALRSELELRARCASCRPALASLEQALDQIGHDAPLVADEIHHRGAIYRELTRLGPLARLQAIESDEGVDFRSWGVADLLIRNVLAAGSPAEKRTLADLALLIAQRLDADLYRPVYLADLQARAQAALALVELRASHLEEARARLDLARSTARLGLGETLPEIFLVEAELSASRRASAQNGSRPAEGTSEGLTARLLSRLLRSCTAHQLAAGEAWASPKPSRVRS